MPEPRPDDVPDELLDLYGRNYDGNTPEQAERKALAAVLAVHERQVRERAERAERDRDKALDQIATERRGKLAAQAAVRRARELADRADADMADSFARQFGGAPFPAMVPTEVLRAALDAEGRHDEALDLLRDLTDTRPCTPHPGTGFCQTHGEKPPCPHGAATALLATLDQPKETT